MQLVVTYKDFVRGMRSKAELYKRLTYYRQIGSGLLQKFAV